MPNSCPRCQAPLKRAVRFCGRCGADLRATTPIPQVPLEIEEEMPPAGTPIPFDLGGAAPEDAPVPLAPDGTAPEDAPEDAPVPFDATMIPDLPVVAPGAALPDLFVLEDLPTQTIPRQASEWDAPAARRGGALRLRLHILNTGQITDYLDGGPALIGRRDPSARIFPVVDFAPAGGERMGVSRRHARIYHEAAGYFVEDLGSSNGTFVNDQRLGPNQPTLLHHQDDIRVGSFTLRVMLEPGNP